jgi:hypothetical protein
MDYRCHGKGLLRISGLQREVMQMGHKFLNREALSVKCGKTRYAERHTALSGKAGSRRPALLKRCCSSWPGLQPAWKMRAKPRIDTRHVKINGALFSLLLSTSSCNTVFEDCFRYKTLQVAISDPVRCCNNH